MSRWHHYWGLAAAIALGLGLRFWNLDLKPLWLDEAVTLVFALGHRYGDIPRDLLLPLTDLLGALTWQPQSCGAIAQAVSQESTHPPLFFCLMHQWLGYVQQGDHSLRWQMRSFSALFGVGVIAAVYGLNRVAFSHQAGLCAAGLMAVSPFAVYLSQEARHYTLPMLVITLSLIPFVRICAVQPSKSGQRFAVWLAWIGLNSLGFYIHYFCILAFIGQVVTLLWIAIRQRQWKWMGFGVMGIGVFALTLMPWLPTVLIHMHKPETDWLRYDWHSILDWLKPLIRLLGGVIVFVVMLPVETQSLVITILNGLLMLVIAGYVGQHLWKRIPEIWQDPKTRLSVEVLGSFLCVVWLEYLLLVYGLHKDLTLAFRYNFVFYPAVCALIAASLVKKDGSRPASRLGWVLILVGLLSTGFVVTDLAFQKPFAPQQTAEKLLHNSAPALVVVKDYQNWQDVALGVSIAYAVQQFDALAAGAIQWAFIKPKQPLTTDLPKFTLWHIGALQAKQINQFTLDRSENRANSFKSDGASTPVKCTPTQRIHPEMGIQYQPFRCG